MMQNAQSKQFKLNDMGQILYQPDASNPLPGEAVAILRKGDGALSPAVDVMPSAHAEGQDPAAVDAHLKAWLKQHVQGVLEHLTGLAQTEGLAAPVQGICQHLYAAMGIAPRGEMESFIKDLDPEMRQALRAKGVRLGPVLVFLPALNKPAAVRLRGLLWALWNDQALPAPVPNDGSVSVVIDAETANRDFYQSIGYPVYGRRAVRIDMLDRVISAVYDGARDGKFQARHEMAEWLGCSIEDLYAVLESMGHQKFAEQEPASAEAPLSEASATPEVSAPQGAPVPPPKPALAFFHLKKGRGGQKPFVRKPKEADGVSRPKRQKKPHRPKEKKKNREEMDRPRVISAVPKVKTEQSPFAILQQLKVGKDAS